MGNKVKHSAILKIMCALALLVSMFGLIVGCGEVSTGSQTSQKTVYTITAEELNDCTVGTEITLPAVTVKDSNGNVVELSFSVAVYDPQGNAVKVTDGKFTASVVGEYKVVISLDETSKEITFRCKTLQQPAVADLGVASDGTLTFTAKVGAKYALYRGDEKIGEIVPGANVSGYIGEGVNVFTVVTLASGDYADSDRSNEAKIEKVAAVKDLSVGDDYVVTFTEAAGVSYEFYINGSSEPETFNSGDNIKSYLVPGANTLVVIGKKAGALDSAVSVEYAVNLLEYPPVGDLEVEDGKVVFTETAGMSYTLFIDGENKGAVTSGAAIADYLSADAELLNLKLQVQVNASGDYDASDLSNEVGYFYNRIGGFGSVVYDGTNRAHSPMASVVPLTENEDKFYRFVSGKTVDADGNAVQYGAGVRFDQPLAVNTDAGAVYYLRLRLRGSADLRNPYYGFGRGTAAVYNQYAMQVHFYDSKLQGSWFYADIQISDKNLGNIEGFYIEIAQNASNGIGYLDVGGWEIVSYKPVATSLGTVTSASINSFGKDTVSYWSVPYDAEQKNESLTVGERTFDGYTRLSKQGITFGGNTTFATNGTSHVGALLQPDFSAYSGVIEVTLLLKTSSSCPLLIEGYYGSALTKSGSGIITPTTEWQSITLTLKTRGLQGIAFVSQNNRENYSEAPEILIAAIDVEEMPVASNFSVSPEGEVTFTQNAEYSYNLLNGNGEVLAEDIDSGYVATLADGLNEFAIQTVGTNFALETDVYEIFKSFLGYGILEDYTRNSVNVGKHDIEFSTGSDGEMDYLRIAGDGNGTINSATVLFGTPLAVPAASEGVSYLRLHVRLSSGDAADFNTGSFGVYGYEGTLIVHVYYSDYRGEWMDVEIQLNGLTEIVGFFTEIAGTTNSGIGYIDVASAEIVTYPVVQTPLGDVTTATVNEFGKAVAYWAVPYEVSYVAENFTTDGSDYSGYVSLKKEFVTFGGNTTFAVQGTSNPGALLAYTSNKSGMIGVVATFKATAGLKIAVGGYYGGSIDKTNVITATGKWQEIELVLASSNLKGIFFVAQNISNDASSYIRYAPASEICIAGFRDSELPIADNFKVAKDGTVTFTQLSEYSYNLLNGEGEVLAENIDSGYTVTLVDGLNEFVVRTVGESGLTMDTAKFVIFKSFLGYGVLEDYTKGSINVIKHDIDFSTGTEETVNYLRISGVGDNTPNGATVLFDSPLAVPAASEGVSYLRLRVRFSLGDRNPYYNFTRGSFGVYGYGGTLAVHSYDSNYRGEWMYVEIQLSGLTEVAGFFAEIAQAANLELCYIDVASAEIVTYPVVQTPLGDVTAATVNAFGKAVAYWAVPYEVSYVTENFTTVGMGYTGYVSLKKELVTLGGNTTWANQGTYNPGALISYSTQRTGTFKLTVMMKATAGAKIAIGGYYGTTLDKSNVFTGTGDWQLVTLTVSAENLQGIFFVATNDQTHYTSASEILVAGFFENEADAVVNAVTDLSVGGDGTVTFTQETGCTYLLYRNGELIDSDLASGDQTGFVNSQNNAFFVKSVKNGLTADSKTITMWYSISAFIGLYDTDNPLSDGSGITYSEQVKDNVNILNVLGNVKGAGGGVLLKTPLQTINGKINYAVVTFYTAGSKKPVTGITFGVNGNADLAVSSGVIALNQKYIKAYIQLPADVTEVTSIYYRFDELSKSEAFFYVCDVTVLSVDTEQSTALGTWQTASYGGLGSDPALWAMPYTLTETTETVTVGESVYASYTQLKDDGYSFGGKGTMPSVGEAFRAGALLKYTYTGDAANVMLKITVNITSGVKVAVGGYYGNGVDTTTTVITGTGDWQEITVTLASENLSGITFVSVGDSAPVAASVVKVAAVTEI